MSALFKHDDAANILEFPQIPFQLPRSSLPVQAMMELFDQPIYFHPWAARVTGSALGALWLSYGIRETQRLMGDDFNDGTELFGGSNSRKQVLSLEDCWFEAKVEAVKAFMGMTRWEQQTAKKALKELNVLDERHTGLPAKKEYRINMPTLMSMLSESRGVPSSATQQAPSPKSMASIQD